MDLNKRFLGIFATVLSASAVSPAFATFHLMQIEQVIGGVNGDSTAQAIQLRMRSPFQNQVQQGRLRVWDASGQNPIVLVDMTVSVPNSGSGVRVLITTANFGSFATPAVSPDFIMTSPIPASYLAAGSLTFESDFGTVYWRLSWGGAAYTGSTTGSIINDADGQFGPPFAGPLPSTTFQALQFQGTASALSTNNAADYALTSGAALFTNNAGFTFQLGGSSTIDILCLTPFDSCMTGPGGLADPACGTSDGNADLHIDLRDYALIQLRPGCK